MYIFGGFNGNTKTHFNDLYRYSIKENAWEYLNVTGNIPCKRRRQACLIYKDIVYLFGGTRSDLAILNFYCFTSGFSIRSYLKLK